MEPGNNPVNEIVYSCYYEKSRSGEHFVPEHVLTFQVSGSLIHYDGTREYRTDANSIRLITRNHLLKVVKIPPKDGPFKSLSLFLDQALLKRFSVEHDINVQHHPGQAAIIPFSNEPLLKVFFDSLLAYADQDGFTNPDFIAIKQTEALLLLLRVNPALKEILFDFSEPHKIDLEEFMNRNYQFNVRMERFATLTGRSLATFKRDFEKQFGIPPRKWLQQKRLQEAYFQIRELGKSPSDVYWDVGFEDLSHFSFAFKKQFGVSPTKIN